MLKQGYYISTYKTVQAPCSHERTFSMYISDENIARGQKMITSHARELKERQNRYSS